MRYGIQFEGTTVGQEMGQFTYKKTGVIEEHQGCLTAKNHEDTNQSKPKLHCLPWKGARG